MTEPNEQPFAEFIREFNEIRQGFIDAGFRTASREEWIRRTGQDPKDPSTWNNTYVDAPAVLKRLGLSAEE